MATVRETIFKTYSNVAMAHAALDSSATSDKYDRVHYSIRTKLYKGLCNGTMKIGSMWDEEKKKIKFPRCCYYCGSTEKLTVDHLIPRAKEEIDTSDNLVYACRSCNSSKNKKDLLEFYAKKDSTPPINLLVRYLKICFSYCEKNNLLDLAIDETENLELPFAIQLFPSSLPQPKDLKYFVVDL